MNVAPRGATNARPALLAACCVVITVLCLSVKSLAANFYALPSATLLEDKKYSSVSIEYLEGVQLLLKKALMLEPNNADFYSLNGRITSILWSRLNVEDSAKHEALADIEINYRKAVELHPFSGFKWMYFARGKAQSLEFDEEFYQAVGKAVEYAGMEYQVNKMIVEVGLMYWYSLRVEYRQLMKKAFRNLYSLEPHATIELARRYGQFRMGCLWVKDFQQKVRACTLELLD